MAALLKFLAKAPNLVAMASTLQKRWPPTQERWLLAMASHLKGMASTLEGVASKRWPSTYIAMASVLEAMNSNPIAICATAPEVGSMSVEPESLSGRRARRGHKPHDPQTSPQTRLFISKTLNIQKAFEPQKNGFAPRDDRATRLEKEVEALRISMERMQEASQGPGRVAACSQALRMSIHHLHRIWAQ